MIPIIVAPAAPQETFEHKVHRAAEHYSEKPDLQDAFISGAKWATPDCDFTGFQGLVLVLVIIGSISSFGSFVGGLANSGPNWNDGVKWDIPAKKIFPFYNLGLVVGKWLMTSKDKK